MSTQRHEITVKHNGKEYTGHYYVEGGVITVSANWRKQSTQLGSSPDQSMARRLLCEMIDGGAFEEP